MGGKRKITEFVLTNCGHNFCKTPLANDIYQYQWFDGFNNKCPLFCPLCNCQLKDNESTEILDHLVFLKKLQRKNIFTHYLNKEWTNKLYNLVTFGKNYNCMEREQLEILWQNENNTPLYSLLYPNENPSIVYYEKYLTRSFLANFPMTGYTFEIDYPTIKDENNIKLQDLVEYIFHPDRVKRMGIEFLDN